MHLSFPLWFTGFFSQSWIFLYIIFWKLYHFILRSTIHLEVIFVNGMRGSQVSVFAFVCPFHLVLEKLSFPHYSDLYAEATLSLSCCFPHWHIEGTKAGPILLHVVSSNGNLCFNTAYQSNETFLELQHGLRLFLPVFFPSCHGCQTGVVRRFPLPMHPLSLSILPKYLPQEVSCMCCSCWHLLIGGPELT